MQSLQPRVSILAMIVAAVVMGRVAAAQPTILSIDEATLVAELEANDPRVAIAAAKVTAARADIAVARLRPNPSISIEREEPFVNGTAMPTNYLRLNVPFDISGRRGLLLDAAAAAVRAATSDAAQNKHELLVAALRVFDDCARARLQVEILTSSRAMLVRSVEIARERGKAGDASGYEIQRFELELAGHDDDLASAQIDLVRVRTQLATLTGRTGELDASTTLELPTAVPTLELDRKSVV